MKEEEYSFTQRGMDSVKKSEYKPFIGKAKKALYPLYMG